MKKLSIKNMEFSFKCENCNQPLYLWSGLCHNENCKLSLQNNIEEDVEELLNEQL